MKSTGVLVKLSGPLDGHRAALAAAVPAEHEIQPLFTVAPAPPPPGQAAAAVPQHTWVSVKPRGDGLAAQAAVQHPWDMAHEIRRQLGARALAAEPDLEQAWLPDVPGGENTPARAARAEDPSAPDGEKGAPYVRGPHPNWHLDDDYSQLRAAREAAGSGQSTIKIVHLDTGYDPKHKARPEFVATNEERNFVDTDRPNSAEDMTPTSGVLLNRGHGTGTMGILAGPKVTGVRPTQDGKSLDRETLGGAPMMSIVPVRIANSVVHFGTSTVAQGIDYAVSIGADVVSMSMGGLPSQAWADAVNKAYEAGIVVVCAAGNNFGGLPTGLVVYPARFDRVIAACGAIAEIG